MALSATIYTFKIELSHVDRGAYESLELRVAKHPSESDDYLLTRVLAYCLEYTEGIGFSKGLSEPDEPALFVRDRTGQLQAWIEVGLPEAARLHRASKASPRVAVYTHRDPARLLDQLAGERIHRREALEIYAVDRPLMTAWSAHLERRMVMDLSVSDQQIYLGIGTVTLMGSVTRYPVPTA